MIAPIVGDGAEYVVVGIKMWNEFLGIIGPSCTVENITVQFVQRHAGPTEPDSISLFLSSMSTCADTHFKVPFLHSQAFMIS